MSCCEDCQSLAAKHEAACGHFKTEILKLHEEVASLKAQVEKFKECCPVVGEKKVEVAKEIEEVKPAAVKRAPAPRRNRPGKKGRR